MRCVPRPLLNSVEHSLGSSAQTTASGKARLDLVAGGQRAGRARAPKRTPQRARCRAARRLERAAARHVAVETVVGQQLELRQDFVLRVLLIMLGALQHQDDVALRAGRQIQLAAVLADALVAFARSSAPA